MDDYTHNSSKRLKLHKQNFEKIINDFFNKRFALIKESDYKLPEPEFLFTADQWTIEEMQTLKNELNSIKSMLNNYDLDSWHKHTNQRNKAGYVQWDIQRNIKPEFLTQAWLKFYENVSTFPVVPKCVEREKFFTSIHLCEAPGAFITSLNHWLKLNMPAIEWDWIGLTLNPYYEGKSDIINDDRFIVNTLEKWYFGVDDTGDIMNIDNVEGLVKLARSKKNILLVTADGSKDCMLTPAEQEVTVSHLHFCEVYTALNILQSKGSLILKMFTTFEHQSICLIYLLTCLFEEVHMNKPVTSKEGNSEIYVICLNYKGSEHIKPYMQIFRDHFINQNNQAMFRKEDLPESFLNQIISCSRFFKNEQCKIINDNIKTYPVYRENSLISGIKKLKHMVSAKYIEQYNLRKLDGDNDKIVQDYSACLNWTSCKIYKGSYGTLITMNPCEKFNNLIEEINSIELQPQIFSFKLTDEICKIDITEGKQYMKVSNTKFCTLDMLRKLQEFNRIAEIFNYKRSVPKEEDVNLYIQKLNDEKLSFCKILKFKFITEQNHYNTLQQICNVFEETLEGQNIILFGFCLLSRFNAGLLYLLAHAFELLEINLDETLGSIITLKGKKINETINDQLTFLQTAAENAKNRNQAILSVVPITLLCDKFHPLLIKSNAWNIKYYISCSTME